MGRRSDRVFSFPRVSFWGTPARTLLNGFTVCRYAFISVYASSIGKMQQQTGGYVAQLQGQLSEVAQPITTQTTSLVGGQASGYHAGDEISRLLSSNAKLQSRVRELEGGGAPSKEEVGAAAPRRHI